MRTGGGPPEKCHIYVVTGGHCLGPCVPNEGDTPSAGLGQVVVRHALRL